jgi:hypothetical protein
MMRRWFRPPARSTGAIGVSHGVVRWVTGNGRWEMPIDDIGLVGEYTTDAGPWLCDYFVVLVPRPGEEWWELCDETNGLRDAVDTLARRLGPLRFALANVPGWASRIVWPPSGEGQPLFDTKPVPPPPTLLGRLKHRITDPVYYLLTAQAKEALLVS